MRPWGRFRGLIVAATVALMVGGSWTWWVRSNAVVASRVLAPGQVADTSNGARFRLVSMVASAELTSGYGQVITAPPGAVLVLTRVDYDTRDASGAGYCSLWLRAGVVQWPAGTYSPKPPAHSYCEAGETGTVVAMFEVPRRYLDQIDGLAISDAGSPWPVMSATVS